MRDLEKYRKTLKPSTKMDDLTDLIHNLHIYEAINLCIKDLNVFLTSCDTAGCLVLGVILSYNLNVKISKHKNGCSVVRR